jgi:hypothetical protein
MTHGRTPVWQRAAIATIIARGGKRLDPAAIRAVLEV